MYGGGYGARSEHYDLRGSDARRSGSESERARKGGPLGGEMRLAEDALRRINKLLDASKGSQRQELAGAGGGAEEQGDVRIRHDGDDARSREIHGGKRGYHASREGDDSLRHYSGGSGGDADAVSRRRFAVRAGNNDEDDARRSRDSDMGDSDSDSDTSRLASTAGGDAHVLPRATPSVIEWLKGALAVAMSQQGSSSSSLRATSDRLSRNE
jgi:hypothetical protein